MIDFLCKIARTDRNGLLREFLQLVRFGVVGGLSFAMYAGGYGLFTRVLWPEMDRNGMNLLATSIAAVFNFFAHQRFTYQAGKTHGAHIGKYLFVLATGTGLNAFGFWMGHTRFGIDDRIVIVCMALTVPVYTYIMHRQFTFKKSAPCTIEGVSA